MWVLTSSITCFTNFLYRSTLMDRSSSRCVSVILTLLTLLFICSDHTLLVLVLLGLLTSRVPSSVQACSLK